MPFDSEHACRLRDPDEYDDFTRETGAAEVAGREVDHVYGTEGDYAADLQSVRYPLANGWDTQTALLDAQEHCESLDGLAFEPAEGFASMDCLSCGTDNHAMTQTKQTNEDLHGVTHAKAVDTMDIGGEETEVLRVPISSTRADREGDEFSREALEDMADQIREEKPLVFQNHGLAGDFMSAIPYDQAETIGTHQDAEVVEADDGESELVSSINPDGTHPEGERMLKQVRDENQAVKFSVGFKIHGYEEKEDDQGNTVGRIFTDVDLMEDSKVGIPANPDASAPVGASAKNDDQLPGYQMHPMMQMMKAMQGESTGPSQEVATKTLADGGDPEETDADGTDELREQVEDLALAVSELRTEVSELRDDDSDDDDDGDSCSVDDDCPDGKVCVDGECVDEDEADSLTPDATDAADDADVQDKIAELEDQLKQAKAAVRDGPGDSETGDPTTDDADLVAETDDDSDDEQTTKDATKHDTLL